MQTTVEPIPAILNLDQAIEKFRETVNPLIDPAQEENWDGVKLKEKEMAILQAGLELVGHCIAILIYHLSLTASVKLAANVRAHGKAGFNYVNQTIKEVPITVIGGVQVDKKDENVLQASPEEALSLTVGLTAERQPVLCSSASIGIYFFPGQRQ